MNDPYWAIDGWNLKSNGSNSQQLEAATVAGDDVDAPAGWQASTGVGETIAVIDTGIQPNHPDLILVGGKNFTNLPVGQLEPDDNWNDGHGHGTHVAGTIAALNNNLGVVGVAPGAGLYAVKVLDDVFTVSCALVGSK